MWLLTNLWENLSSLWSLWRVQVWLQYACASKIDSLWEMFSLLELGFNVFEILEALQKHTWAEFEIVNHLIFLILQILDLFLKVPILPFLALDDLYHLIFAHVICRFKKFIKHFQKTNKNSKIRQNLHVASRPFLAGDAIVVFLIGGLEEMATPDLSCWVSLLGATNIRREADPDRSRLSFLAGLLDCIPFSELSDLL